MSAPTETEIEAGFAHAAAIGEAFVTIAVISKTLGHSDLICTVRDYLAPHGGPLTPAQRFVQDAILHGADAVIPDSMVGECLAGFDLPPLPAV